jgi:N-glycosylase/DNA lyase
VWNENRDGFEDDVYEVLTDVENRFDKCGSYRFPRLRANQLAKLRLRLHSSSLSEMINKKKGSVELRAWLVDELPGIGPKQASMFLRNIGYSYDLAILDSHVVKFLERVKLLKSKTFLSTLSGYEKTEKVMKNYAVEVGQPVGVVDWAIWITMKAEQETKA